MMEKLVRFLQNMDNRVLYAALALIIAVPLLKPFKFAVFINEDTRGVFEKVEKTPADKLIVLAAEWEAGTKGELGPQTAAIIEHLFMKGRKFAIISTNPSGSKLV